MNRILQNSRRLAWGSGIVLGLIIGLNMQGLWPSVPLHASATHGFDKFAIATGLVDDSVEALYFLDFLTGDMRAAVINPKTGKFNSFFTRNIAADFGGAGRNSGYLMVTGSVDMPRGTANFQFAKSIVYVAEASTGQVAAYTIPWNSSMQAAGKTAVRRIPAARRAASSAPRSSATNRPQTRRSSERTDEDSSQRRVARNRRRQHGRQACSASWASRSRTWRSS